VPKTWGNRAGFNAKNQGRRWEFVRLEAEEISFSAGNWAFVLLEGDEIACFGGGIGKFVHLQRYETSIPDAKIEGKQAVCGCI
jgi:hypothetical protein